MVADRSTFEDVYGGDDGDRAQVAEIAISRTRIRRLERQAYVHALRAKLATIAPGSTSELGQRLRITAPVLQAGIAGTDATRTQRRRRNAAQHAFGVPAATIAQANGRQLNTIQRSSKTRDCRDDSEDSLEKQDLPLIPPFPGDPAAVCKARPKVAWADLDADPASTQALSTLNPHAPEFAPLATADHHSVSDTSSEQHGGQIRALESQVKKLHEKIAASRLEVQHACSEALAAEVPKALGSAAPVISQSVAEVVQSAFCPQIDSLRRRLAELERTAAAKVRTEVDFTMSCSGLASRVGIVENLMWDDHPKLDARIAKVEDQVRLGCPELTARIDEMKAELADHMETHMWDNRPKLEHSGDEEHNSDWSNGGDEGMESDELNEILGFGVPSGVAAPGGCALSPSTIVEMEADGGRLSDGATSGDEEQEKKKSKRLRKRLHKRRQTRKRKRTRRTRRTRRMRRRRRRMRMRAMKRR